MTPPNLSNQLPVSEVFYTIQGEGRWSGFPAIFVRFQYCHLGCSWCDTRYTWDKNNHSPHQLFTVEKLVDKIINTLPSRNTPAPHIVITGGEPMLFQENIASLIIALKNQRFNFIEIETSGTITPSPLMMSVVDWWNCSPKLSNSLLDKHSRYIPDTLRVFSEMDNVDYKFVVRNIDDIKEMEQDFSEIIQSDRIWLMPESISSTSHIKRLKSIVPICLERGYVLAPRLHILLWENQRGK